MIYLPIAEMPVNVLLVLLASGAVGFVSGLVGIGGGFIMTPALIFLGIPGPVAVATGASQIAATSFSGLLTQTRRKAVDWRMGGPSDRQFSLSPGVHVTPVVDYAKFNPGTTAGRRRSVYRFLFRTLPDPFMDALDCPEGSQLAPVCDRRRPCDRKRTHAAKPLDAMPIAHQRRRARSR